MSNKSLRSYHCTCNILNIRNTFAGKAPENNIDADVKILPAGTVPTNG